MGKWELDDILEAIETYGEELLTNREYIMDKLICDYCLNIINDTDEEISAVMLGINNAKYIFCDDDCLKEFICGCSWDVYVTPDGHIVD